MTKTKLEKVVFRNELHHHKTRNIYDLTNRFHFAVRLYSDNAQMTSKRGENKEVRYEPQASSVTDVLTRFDVLCALSECRPTFTFTYSSFTGILRTHNMTSSQLA